MIKTSNIHNCYLHQRDADQAPLFGDGGDVCVQLHGYALIPLEVFHNPTELAQAIANAKFTSGVRPRGEGLSAPYSTPETWRPFNPSQPAGQLVCEACAGDAPGGKCKTARCVGGPIVGQADWTDDAACLSGLADRLEQESADESGRGNDSTACAWSCRAHELRQIVSRMVRSSPAAKGMAVGEQTAREQVLEGALRSLMRGYVNLLENGRNRILDLGGQCDPVDKMEASDPYLREARNAFTPGVAVPRNQGLPPHTPMPGDVGGTDRGVGR